MKEREASEIPSYIQVGGTSDGITPLFIGAVEVGLGAVRVSGSTRDLELRADRSDAVAWSTNMDAKSFATLIGDVSTETAISGLRAYKVLGNNTLEAKGIQVIQNADGSLTLKAFSDGNSTYVFLYEPAKIDVDNPDAPTAPETSDAPQTGDNSDLWLWVALLFVSGAGLAGTTIYGRKRRTN